MPSGDIDLSPRRPVDWLDISTETGSLVQPATSKNIILTFRTPAGTNAKISDYRQAWDAGLDTYLSHYLRVNGMIVWPVKTPDQANATYVGSKVQICPPEADVSLPRPIWIGQNCLVEMLVDVASGGVAGNVTGRIICKLYALQRPGPSFSHENVKL